MLNPHQFIHAYRVELRLLCIKWPYLLLHGLWGAFVLNTFAARDFGSAQALLEVHFVRFGTSFIGLMAIFFTGYSATRSQRARFADIEASLPTAASMSVGRLFACLTALSLFFLTPLPLALRAGPPSAFIDSLPVFLVSVGVSVGFITIVTWWLMTYLGLTRWAYPLLVVVWLAFATLPNVLNQQLPEQPTFAALFSFLRVGTGAAIFSEVFGRLRQGNLPHLYNLFYALLTVALLIAFIGDVMRRRFYHRPFIIGMLLPLVSAAIIGTGITYAQTVQAGRLRAVRDTPDAPLPADVLPPASATTYNIRMNLQTPERPQFDVRLTMRHEGEAPMQTIPLTLYYGFDVHTVSVPYERDHDTLVLMLPQPQPGETLDVQFQYSGTVWRTATFSGVPEAFDFTSPTGLRLSYNLAWYPLVGEYALSTFRSLPVAASSAVFQLRLENAPDDFTVASNLLLTGKDTFASPGARWAFVMASPQLVTGTVNGVRYITSRNDDTQFASVITTYVQPTLDHFLRYVPIDAPRILTVYGLYNADIETLPSTALLLRSGGPFVGSSYFTASADEVAIGLLPTASDDLLSSESGALQLGYPLASVLWTADGTPHHPALLGIAQFLWLHFLTDGDADAITEQLEALSSDPIEVLIAPVHAENSAAFAEALNVVYRRHGDDALRLVLQALKTSDASLTDATAAQIVTWMEAQLASE